MLLKKLFEPITIKNLSIRNRIIMPAMHTNQGSMEEGISDNAMDFYISRAKGGFGMIGIGVIDSYFFPGASSPHAYFLMNDEHVKRFRSLIREVKKYGATVIGQTSVRRVFNVSELHRYPRLSAIPETQVYEMIDSLVQTAVRIREAGFDMLELMGIGGSAISLFLSKVYNDRTDQWGGNLEGRLRFPLEIMKRIRTALGDDYPVSFRFHGSEFIHGGYSTDTEKLIAQKLEEAGVDFFNVSGGGHGTHVPGLSPSMPRGGFAFLAMEIKNAVNVPVAASNRINHPFTAEEILRTGWADMVSIGRGALADHEWANKAKKGNFEEIRLCIACNECLDSVVIDEKPIRCTVNPRVGRVAESIPLPRAERRKTVLVIGGGCTGLQAALTCAERGHRVSLIEKEPYLGGKWRLAAVPPGREELLHYLHWLFREAVKAGVDIEIETKFSPELVRQKDPDVVIVCTGSRSMTPDIPGIGQPHVCSAEEALDGDAELGERVIVIGGGGVGSETALYLAKRWSCSPEIISFLTDFEAFERETISSFRNRGHKVTVIDQLEKIGEGLGPSTRWIVKREMALAGVKMVTGTRVMEIKRDGILVESKEGDDFIEADSVVMATGYCPDPSLYEDIKNLAPEVYIAGMALKDGHTIEGTGNAFEVAMNI